MSRYRCVLCRKHVWSSFADGEPKECPHCGNQDQLGGLFQLIPTKPPCQKVYWDKKERDIVYWKDGTIEMDDGTEMTASGATGHLLHYAFDCVEVHDGRSLTKELEARGYDMTTLKFEIRKKVNR
jgi:hypothetical protein